MDRAETLKIMAVLKAAYPSYYKDAEDAKAAVSLWQTMFAADDYALVSAAVQALIAAKVEGYPPTIGAVKAKIRLIAEPEAMSEGEAWSLVMRAIKRAARYSPKEAFSELPPVIQACLGSPSTLREWGYVDNEDLSTVVASNFQRTYRAKAAYHQEYTALPPDVKALAESLSGKLAFGKREALTEGEWNSRRNELVNRLEAQEA